MFMMVSLIMVSFAALLNERIIIQLQRSMADDDQILVSRLIIFCSQRSRILLSQHAFLLVILYHNRHMHLYLSALNPTGAVLAPS